MAAVLGGSHAQAGVQGITGKKLLLKSNPKMVLLSKDALVIPGATGSSSDPRCAPDGGGLGGSVKLDDGTNSVTLSMPCANWSANSAGTLYKYKDTTGTPKVEKLKTGRLKVVSPGMGGFPVPNGAASVDVEVTVGTDRYCMTFSGTGDGDKFLVKDATAGTCPCEATTGGFCWYLGSDGQSCDAVCAGLGLTCDPATITYAGSAGTDANCRGVLNALGFAGFLTNPSESCTNVSLPGLGCVIDTFPYGVATVRCAEPPTTCSTSDSFIARACACQ